MNKKNQSTFHFDQQVVLITGGTRGIGRGIAEAFLRAKAKVVVTYRKNKDEALKFEQDNEAYRENLETIQSDVTDFKACEELISYLEDKYEKVDVLVNNSGIREDNLVPLMSEESFKRVLETNLFGSFYMCKALSQHFLKNRSGRIINISSIGGKLAMAGQANYAASKAGQTALAKTLSKELGRKGITVNTVAPGFIETELLDGLHPDQVKEYKRQIPQRRFGKVSEVASVVCFLASQEASYINGATIEVSGGLG